MKLLLYVYKCGNCGAEFKAPGISGIVYGELLLRSNTGQVAYLDAIKDPHFDEISKILENNKYLGESTKDSVVADILHAIYGAVCDAAPDGSHYQLDRQPNCVKCGSDNMFSWTPTEPHESIEGVPNITYSRWDSLSLIEKQNLIDKAVDEFLKKNKDL